MSFFNLAKRSHHLNISLRWVLIIPFIMQIVTTVALVGYIFYHNGQKALEYMANRLMDEVSVQIEDHLNNYLNTLQQSIAINYNAVQRGHLNIKNFEEIRQQFWQQIPPTPTIASFPILDFANEQGDEIGYMRLSNPKITEYFNKQTEEKLEINTILFNEVKFEQGSHRGFYLVDEQGKPEKLIYQLDNDPRSTEWYLKAKTTKKPTWSPIYVYHFMKTLGMKAVFPVYDDQGKFQGVLNSGISLFDIDIFLNKLKFSPLGQAFIIEHSGNLVATSTMETPYQKLDNGDPIRLNATQSKNAETRAITNYFQDNSIDLKQIKNHLDLQIPFEHKKLFVEVEPYDDQYGLDWLLVVVIPESDFMSQVEHNIHYTILACTITLLISTFIGLIIASWITHPILKLNYASRLLAEGAWHDFLPENNNITEINGLSQSFNRMSVQIKESLKGLKKAIQELNKSNQELTILYQEREEYTHTLEQKVQERTIELQEANKKLSRLAHLDGLTQIANRRHFDHYLEKEWQRHLRENQYLTLIIIDIDYFKRYNDHYGHQGGDNCLIKVAQTIASIPKRSTDLVVRYGGEEFAIILPNTKPEGALTVAEEIKNAIALLKLPHAQSEVSQYVTLSLGIASLIPNSALNPEDLISKADQALYKAKEQGRDRVIID